MSKHFLDPMIIASGVDKEYFIKSVTFIGGSIYDNKELLKSNPEYLGNLNAQEEEEKLRFEAALRRKQLSLVLAGKMKPHDATELRALFV